MASSNVQSASPSPSLSEEFQPDVSQRAPGTIASASLAMTGSGVAMGGGENPSFTGNNPNDGEMRLSSAFARMPVALSVAVPVRDFRVRNLLAMMPGEVIETRWGHGDDLPLASSDVQLAWSEFEVVDTRLAVRITRLA